MPCCTYLNYSDDCTKPTSDDELNAILAEVRHATGEDWRVSETIWMKHRWFRKPLEMKSYELYSHVCQGEFQVVNFYRPDLEDEWCPSINITNSAGYVVAYLYGVLAGSQCWKDSIE